MSAFVVSKEHIDYLVHAAMAAPRRSCNGYVMTLDGLHVDTESDAVGRALWEENARSVAYRYQRPYDNLPGPIDFDHEALARYRCPCWPEMPFEPVVALKALTCYEYQSCEHPEWNASPVKRFCDELRSWLMQALPGYDAAPWEITAETRIASAA
jgi:hypothetical protein